MKHGWFGPTGLGIGIRPTGIQGWLLTIVFLLASVALARVVHFNQWRWICFSGIVALYFVIIMLTTEEKA